MASIELWIQWCNEPGSHWMTGCYEIRQRQGVVKNKRGKRVPFGTVCHYHAQAAHGGQPAPQTPVLSAFWKEPEATDTSTHIKKKKKSEKANFLHSLPFCKFKKKCSPNFLRTLLGNKNKSFPHLVFIPEKRDSVFAGGGSKNIAKRHILETFILSDIIICIKIVQHIKNLFHR